VTRSRHHQRQVQLEPHLLRLLPLLRLHPLLLH
jgi:hypothetical protein